MIKIFANLPGGYIYLAEEFRIFSEEDVNYIHDFPDVIFFLAEISTDSI